MNLENGNVWKKAAQIIGGTGFATGVMYFLILTNEQAIEHVKTEIKAEIKVLQEKVDVIGSKRILPDAELLINDLINKDVQIMHRLGSLEAFQAEGRRFTTEDGQRLENKLDKVGESQTACLTGISTLTYRVSALEELINKCDTQ